jgi:hypothetical protein
MWHRSWQKLPSQKPEGQKAAKPDQAAMDWESLIKLLSFVLSNEM